MTMTITDSTPATLEGTGFTAEALESFNGWTEQPEWLTRSRANAFGVWSDSPLPGRTDEHWRFTDLRGFDPSSLTTFSATGDLVTSPGSTEYSIAVWSQNSAPAARMVFANNDPRPVSVELNDTLPSGCIVAELSGSAQSQEYLGKLVACDAVANDWFSNLNSAFWGAGALIYVPDGVQVEDPIEVHWLHTGNGATAMPRLLVVCGKGAKVSVVEHHASIDGDGGTNGFSNAVVEAYVEAAANLSFTSIQDLANDVDHFASQKVIVKRDSRLNWNSVGLGAARGKVRQDLLVDGEGAEAHMTGISLGNGRRKIDYDTRQVHLKPNAMSDLAFRSALGDRSKSVWRGMIEVAPGARGTDSYQENRNLLLTSNAHADSIPGLQIETNDVRCTHGATIAKVDPEQLFYLVSRGIDRAEAVRTLVRGFYAPIIDRVPEEAIREKIRETLWLRLEKETDVLAHANAGSQHSDTNDR